MTRSRRRIDSKAMRCVRRPPKVTVQLTTDSNPQDEGNDREPWNTQMRMAGGQHAALAT